MVKNGGKWNFHENDKPAYRSGNLDISHSGWPAYPGEQSVFDSLTGDHRSDIVVVGAGLSGGSLALHLAEGGAHVAVLEAREPGWGASGRNAGQVIGHRDMLSGLKSYPDKGEAFLDLWRREERLTFRLAQKHAIDCDAVNGGYLKVATRPNAVALAQKHAEKQIALGLPVRILDRTEAVKFTGSDLACGGVLDESGGRINPFYFTRGLASTARKAGASIYARSPVDRVEPAGSRWRAVTANGSITADQVVFCTGGYGHFEGIPAVRDSWCPLLGYVLATKPLPASIRDQILPSGGIMSDLPAGINCGLVDGLGRFFTSALPGRRAEDIRPALAQLRRWFDKAYPAMRSHPLEVDAYWTGAMAWATDMLPYVMNLGPGMMMLNGFGGDGNAPAPLLGKHLAEKILAGSLHELAIPIKPAETIRWRNRYTVLIRHVLGSLSRTAQRMRLPI